MPSKKTASRETELSRRERQIMEIVYQLGEASVAQVRTAMPNAPARNSVRTLMGILERKGHLRHRMSERTYIYRPTRPPVLAGQSAVRRVIDTFFSGSLAQALAVYLSPPDAKISEEELRQIETLVRNAKKNGG
ncbi:MAG TPA: BlaI/MecI/CopY family transcriptional regulator [Pirellulales bacterium]|nr:BlaI/MecI/CopY family transcriptional regulator [Pirellulales bacterium]